MHVIVFICTQQTIEIIISTKSIINAFGKASLKKNNEIKTLKVLKFLTNDYNKKSMKLITY